MPVKLIIIGELCFNRSPPAMGRGWLQPQPFSCLCIPVRPWAMAAAVTEAVTEAVTAAVAVTAAATVAVNPSQQQWLLMFDWLQIGTHFVWNGARARA